MTSPLSPECRLVFRTAGPGDAAAEVAALAAGPIDWGRVVYLAEKESASSATWRALEAAGAPVPADLAAHLRRFTMVSDFRMMRLADRLAATVRAFRERGIPVMLLKGAAIGALVDPTFRSRPMNDIDLLVRRADLRVAREAVLAAGWPPNDDVAMHELLRDHHHLPPFFDAQVPDLRLELHDAVLPPGASFAIDTDDLWHDSAPAPAPFEGALVPSPEYLLLHASVHFAWAHTMHFGAWRTMRLIHEVVERRPSWDAFVALARRAGGASSAYWTLRLATRLSGVRVPPSVLDRLAVPPQAWLRDMLERHFIADIATGEGTPSPSIRVSRFLWRLALRPPTDEGFDGHWKHDPRWGRSRGADVGQAESTVEHLLRHARGVRRWWDFARRTLGASD